MKETQPYNLYLDYKGYMIEPRSYRVLPASLMGTKFASGRTAYASLDFWQVGAMTDWSHGINQKFLVDPSSSYYAEGIDMSIPGEITLERDVSTLDMPASCGLITARYRQIDALYLGTDNGKIFRTTDGESFTLDYETEESKIFNFYEIKGFLFVSTGPGNIWKRTGTAAWTKIGTSTEFDSTTTGMSGHLEIYGDIKRGMRFRVPMGGSTFHTLKIYTPPVGTPANTLNIVIYKEDAETELPSETSVASFSIATSATPESDGFYSDTITAFSLVADTNYWLVASMTGGDITHCWTWNYSQDDLATYENGYSATYDTEWTVDKTKDFLFKLKRDSIKKLYFTMVESEYAFGLFDDGIRRSDDGWNWVPEPPDPLWELPSAEGIALNLISIPRGLMIGSKRGLWCFLGGTSGINIWEFPDYCSADNFSGVDKFGHYAIFSIEDLGLFYTEGSQVFPTNFNYLSEGFKMTSCTSMVTSGWDIYATVSDGDKWYLARCNLNYTAAPKFWWLVKELTQPGSSPSSGDPGEDQFTGNSFLAHKPVQLATFSKDKIYIFYSDQSAQIYNKVSGDFQTTGHFVTSYIDENMIRLQKLYKGISCVCTDFPTDTTIKLAYALDAGSTFTEESFAGAATLSEPSFPFANPTLGNKIQIKTTIESSDVLKTPTITDLCWTYILERPADENSVKKNFNFTIIAEDQIEQATGEVEEENREEPRTRQEILNDIWTSADKKSLLNYIGVDNVRELGVSIEYSGDGSTSLITIDRTNYLITVTTTGGIEADSFTYTYKNETLNTVVTAINAKDNFSCTVHGDQLSTRTAHDLEPCYQTEIKGGRYLFVGSDIHCIIFSNHSPSQAKFTIEGAGSDRINMSLRET